MTTEFTEISLPNAIRWLFETNGYIVTGPVKMHGAEIDLVATQLSGFTEQRVYIEATIQYVDTAKYGKDLTKLVMIDDPGMQRMIVSSTGFTADVRERATAANILTFTYDDLLRKFEKTEPYLRYILDDSSIARDLQALDAVYEEPFLKDKHGQHLATDYFSTWLEDEEPQSRWIILVGEYGTGKTALTKVLQRRWAEQYRSGGDARIPFRIELKNFSKQFDARGLLHHFLDRNELSHLPVSFVESMIANGRIVLLLDGYDEMAQYLNVRERRACLEALADLASAGARGILTSRPNYFTEAEELRVFEVLYQRVVTQSLYDEINRSAVEKERNIDKLLQQFVMRRVERQLRDLTETQTLELINRRLSDDPVGAEAVTKLLKRVFRNEGGRPIALSGKPVIVSYLLEVVDELKSDTVDSYAELSEWEVYSLIVDKLMKRDLDRTPELLPTERRNFLQKLALYSSITQAKSLSEDMFRTIIRKQFEARLSRRHAEGATDAEDSLFDDLRSSSTLTRSEENGKFGWQFSHNSLREFLLLNELIESLIAGSVEPQAVNINDSLMQFAGSMPPEKREPAAAQFSALWPIRRSTPGLVQMFPILWSAETRRHEEGRPIREILASIVGQGLDLSTSLISNVSFSARNAETSLQALNASSADFVEVDFSHVDLSESNFSNSALDACVLTGANLDKANFTRVLMLDCDLTDITCQEADFQGLDLDSTAIIRTPNGVTLLEGKHLVGYLKRKGATTEPIDAYYMYATHAQFDVCEKICRVLLDGNWRQRRGVEQRGSAEKNIPLAKKFVARLVSIRYCETKGGTGKELIRATPDGRKALSEVVENQKIDSDLALFFADQFK